MPWTLSPSMPMIRSLARMPALDAGVSSIGETTLMTPVLHGDLDAETAELAGGLHLHVLEVLRVHVARMRVEPGQHAVDRRFDELVVVGDLDIVGAHPLEHVAEQVELPIGVGGGRVGLAAGEEAAVASAATVRRGAEQGTSEE